MGARQAGGSKEAKALIPWLPPVTRVTSHKKPGGTREHLNSSERGTVLLFRKRKRLPAPNDGNISAAFKTVVLVHTSRQS